MLPIELEQMQKLIDQGILHAPGQTFVAEEFEQATSFFLDYFQKRKKGRVRVVEAPRLSSAIADTHAHLEMLHQPALNLARCAFWNVRFICSITDPVEDSKTTLTHLSLWQEQARSLLLNHGLEAYAYQVPHVRVAMGCHPHNAKDYTPAVEDELLRALKNPLVCAIGEVGLDYYYDFSPRPVQREVFRRQIQLAHVTGLPLLLHMREAHDEGFEILSDEGVPSAGVLLHCYNLDKETLKPWLDLGCYVAFGGPLTFKNADEVRKSAASVPIDHLLTETDSPYMTPEPMRGMECGPEHTIFTAQKMIEVLADSDDVSDVSRFEQLVLPQLYCNARLLLDRDVTAWQKS